MKKLLIVIIAAAGLWSGYWFIGSTGLKSGLTQWFDDRRAEGWQADYSEITTRGFPNRFDTTITDLALADPETGLAYSAPFVQLFTLSYQPDHVIAVWPNSQTLQTPFGKAAIRSDDMRASLVVQRNAQLAVQKTHFTAAQLSATLDNGAVFGAKELRAAIVKTQAELPSYHFGLSASDLIVPQPEGLRLNAGKILPSSLAKLHGDVTIAFDAPWDVNALQTRRPQPRAINVKLIEARWGQLELRLAGKLKIDEHGQGSGRITINAKNWRDILQLGVATGALPEALAGPLEQGLSLLSNLSGNKNTLDLPLDLDAGQMRLGPIPLGRAPLFKLR